jgi:hypothetical protein
MEFLNDYIVLIIVGICLCIGYMIKHLIPTDKINKFIPTIMALLGLGLNVWINSAFTPEILLGGLFSGLASTGLHQAFKQFIEKKGEE